MLTPKYSYQSLERHTQPGGKRHYLCPQSGARLPSITTVLDSTSDKTGLLEWRARVGDKRANEIQREALGLGTLMHTHLECHLLGQPRPGGNNLVRQQAEAMADQIIQYGLSKVEEVYGCEVNLYEPGLYAGTTDAVGLFRDPLITGDVAVPAIIDFKTARKMKRREHIENYFMQVASYAMCHDSLYGTHIEHGIIFMVDRDFNFERFVISGAEFRQYQDMWLGRVEQYYKLHAPPIAQIVPQEQSGPIAVACS